MDNQLETQPSVFGQYLPKKEPTTPNVGIDTRAKALTKAIALQENGGKDPTPESYQTMGQSGERGLYQFTQPTWNQYAKEVLGNPKADPTPENQNAVAYGKVKKWLEDGYDERQIASMWNAGQGNPDAHTQGLSGTNKYGARYDVPKYANGVFNYYHNLLKDENVNEETKEPETILRKLVDFAFPIATDIYDIAEGKSKKTALQLLGDAGLSALWFVPGLGAAASSAIKGAGLLGRVGSRVAGEALAGAATGYAADISSKLSQGETEGIFKPGIGTATGGVLGGVLGKVGSKYSQKGVISEISNANNSVIGQTKKGAQELAESFSKGKNPGELLATKGVNLKNMINPETVAYETKAAQDMLRKDAGKLSTIMDEALQKIPGVKNANEIRDEIVNKIGSGFRDKVTASEAQKIISEEFESILQHYGDNLTASDLNKLKQRAWELSAFDMSKTNLTRSTYRQLGNYLKKTIENMADDAGLKGVGDFNEYIGSHLDAAEALQRLEGVKAKGGRLGDLMRKHSMGMVGAGLGGIFGGGIPGSIMGAVAGEWAGGKLANILRGIESSPLKSAILKNMVKEDPQIVQKMLAYARETPQGLEAIKKQLKGMGVNLFDRSKLEGVQVLAPKAEKQGLLSQLTAAAGVKAQTQTGQ